MGRIIKAVLLLAILGFLGLTAFAYLGDLAPPQSEVTLPVVLDAE
jgi:ABC-type dipeptide/oligopeptide/nickel transport system permease subunit